MPTLRCARAGLPSLSLASRYRYMRYAIWSLAFCAAGTQVHGVRVPGCRGAAAVGPAGECVWVWRARTRMSVRMSGLADADSAGAGGPRGGRVVRKL